MHWSARNINPKLDGWPWVKRRRGFQPNQLKNISDFQACLKVGTNFGWLENSQRNHNSLFLRHAELLRLKTGRDRDTDHGASVKRCLNVQRVQDYADVANQREDKIALQRDFCGDVEWGKVEGERVEDFKMLKDLFNGWFWEK